MNFEKEYSDVSFLNKVTSVAKKAGGKLIYSGLLLYYASQRVETPILAKTVMIGALGYFISPVDAVPDITPVVGYVDDLGVLAMALATCAVHINEDVRIKARTKISDLFGDEVSTDIYDVDSSL